MSLPVRVVCGKGSQRAAAVDEYNQLAVAVYPPAPPAQGELNRMRYFRALLGTQGADAGTTDAAVDGSITAQEFYVGANADYDIHITRVVMIVADSAVAHNNFGNVNALANGVDLVISEGGVDTYVVQGAKTGGQLIAQSGIFAPYGDDATSFELLNWTGNADAQTVVFNIAACVPGGVRLGYGSRDKLSLFINDDVTGLNEYLTYAFGYTHHSV